MTNCVHFLLDPETKFVREFVPLPSARILHVLSRISEIRRPSPWAWLEAKSSVP